MVNTAKLRGIIAENGMTQQDAEALYDLLAQHEVTVCSLPHKE